MKRKWKEVLFQAYEKEMGFRDRREEVKSHLTFEENKPKSFAAGGYRFALVGATCAVVCAMAVSSHFAFSPTIRAAVERKDTEKMTDFGNRTSEEISEKNPPNDTIGTLDGDFSFGEGNLYSVSYSFSLLSNKVRFEDTRGNLNLAELILKEGDSILEHIDKEENAFSIQFSSYQSHALIWEYQNESGRIEI